MKKIYRIDVAADAPQIRLDLGGDHETAGFYGQDLFVGYNSGDLPRGNLSKPAAANQFCGVYPGGAFAISMDSLPPDGDAGEADLFYVYESLSAKYSIMTPQDDFVLLNVDVFEDEISPSMENVLFPDFRLFRLRSAKPTDIFFCKDCDDCDDARDGGFMDVYVKMGLKGLVFTEVWRSED